MVILTVFTIKLILSFLKTFSPIWRPCTTLLVWSGDRVHLMFLAFLRNLRDPPQYSWGSGCLVWLYREGYMDNKGAACVFLHSRETPPRPCPSTVWVGTAAAWKCCVRWLTAWNRLTWEGEKELEGGAWTVYPWVGYETITNLSCTSSNWWDALRSCLLPLVPSGHSKVCRPQQH